ncbi:MAG TPA: hypothetical protein VIK89_08390 [Cytophagaceae bacterium]
MKFSLEWILACIPVLLAILYMIKFKRIRKQLDEMRSGNFHEGQQETSSDEDIFLRQ